MSLRPHGSFLNVAAAARYGSFDSLMLGKQLETLVLVPDMVLDVHVWHENYRLGRHHDYAYEYTEQRQPMLVRGTAGSRNIGGDNARYLCDQIA